MQCNLVNEPLQDIYLDVNWFFDDYILISANERLNSYHISEFPIELSQDIWEQKGGMGQTVVFK